MRGLDPRIHQKCKSFDTMDAGSKPAPDVIRAGNDEAGYANPVECSGVRHPARDLRPDHPGTRTSTRQPGEPFVLVMLPPSCRVSSCISMEPEPSLMSSPQPTPSSSTQTCISPSRRSLTT